MRQLNELKSLLEQAYALANELELDSIAEQVEMTLIELEDTDDE